VQLCAVVEVDCMRSTAAKYPDFKLRPLRADDVTQLKYLHTQWFPVEYPNSWYHDITSDTERYMTLAAVQEDTIIGLVVTELRQSKSCSPDEIALLDRAQLRDSILTYIMTLGVRQPFRRMGIASVLVKEILSRLKTLSEVKGVYLHVLASNKHAIKFYESLGFGCCEFIPHYYSIMGHFQNAYCYILYMHDGQPPPTPMQVIIRSLRSVFSYVYTLWMYVYMATKSKLRQHRTIAAG